MGRSTVHQLQLRVYHTFKLTVSYYTVNEFRRHMWLIWHNNYQRQTDDRYVAVMLSAIASRRKISPDCTDFDILYYLTAILNEFLLIQNISKSCHSGTLTVELSSTYYRSFRRRSIHSYAKWLLFLENTELCGEYHHCCAAKHRSCDLTICIIGTL